MKIFIPILIAILFSITLSAQTIGNTVFEEDALQGYTFFSPFSGTKAYMVDNCGRLVNTWDRGTRPGLAAYFLDNGLMMRTYKVDPPQGPFTSASNAGGLELVDWDNNRVWGYEWNTPTSLSHHDAVMMENGHILMLIWDIISDTDLIALGRDPNEIASEGYAWNERIVEVELVGDNDINILWEWRIRDHYIQDFDASKENFGVVAEHPELFDINLADINDNSNSHPRFDYNHFNAIDYNEELDQILISVRNSDEIWILDHSTTTEEAATHSGGNYGKGGDILYRWGNPSAYQRATESDQQLFGQHGVNWIRDGLTDAGKILIYNNGNRRPGTDFSEVHILVPPQDANGGYILDNTAPFGPLSPEWTYGSLTNNNFFSPFLSNVQRLSNGNTLINAGSPGEIFEINPAEEKVWEYIIPLNGDNPVVQGNDAFNNGNFRAYKFAEDFIGFDNLDLMPGDLIEIDNNPPVCNIVSGVETLEKDLINMNYSMDARTLTIALEDYTAIQTEIFTMDGKRVFYQKDNGQYFSYALDLPMNGIYFVRVATENGNSGILKIGFME